MAAAPMTSAERDLRDAVAEALRSNLDPNTILNAALTEIRTFVRREDTGCDLVTILDAPRKTSTPPVR